MVAVQMQYVKSLWCQSLQNTYKLLPHYQSQHGLVTMARRMLRISAIHLTAILATLWFGLETKTGNRIRPQ